MRQWMLLSVLSLAVAGPAVTGALAGSGDVCAHGLGVDRVIEIDTTGGPLFGDVSKQVREPTFLRPREVVLTFDDGPLPQVTRPILDTLDRFCTKASFFVVGRMAVAYPDMLKEVARRGHTVGTHTWSHPLNLRRLSPERAAAEIEKGFAAATLAVGQPVAPFFRFPGLNDSPELLTYAQSRGIGSFTVDVISDDSFIGSVERLTEITLRRTEARGGGILLFHDIKAVTARALPAILAGLKARGFKVVHLRARTGFAAEPELMADLESVIAKARARNEGAAVETALGATLGRASELLAPPPRTFEVATLAPPQPAAEPRAQRKRPRHRSANTDLKLRKSAY
jgi:peptidoglycan/xylan/chitin deacetylase (PgdA/CDA1 family)